MKLALVLLVVAAMTALADSTVTRHSFGKMPDGTPVEIYTLKDGQVEARITTYGGILVSLKTPDRKGQTADIVLGFDSLDGYTGGNKAYFGAIIGRYANRIAHGAFELHGKKYSLPKNNGENSLHGGTQGFDKALWQAKQIPDGIELTHVSRDGDQGYPGALTAVVRYTLHANVLRIEYSATTDADTVVNLTNHSYFNLAGAGNGDILGHQLKLNASRFTPVDQTLIPQRIDADHEQLRFGRGYDHNWVLDGGGKLAEAAELYDAGSGRVLQVFTTEPGIQFYTGNFLDGTITGKGGKVYGHRSALCLETQHFPDSPNHPKFPSAELKPRQRYHTITEFHFSTR
jgi:aldose 1-epimerase